MADSIIANSNLTFDESIQEGDKLLEQKNFAPAIKCYLLAIKKKPKSAYAYYKIGNAFLEENKWQIAEEYFLQAISHSPNLADAHYCLGFTLENSGKNKEAIAAYYRALELDNSCQKYREKLEELLIQKGFDWRFYTEYYQDDIEVSAPETAYQHWLEIGAQKKLCRNEEEFYQQIGCQTSALPEDFDYQNYLYLNPDVEDKYGKNQYQAIRHFLVYREKEKREYDLNSARAHYVRGERLSKRNRIDEAIAAYCCSLELDSTSQKCRNKLEELLSRKGFDWQFYTEYYQDDIEVSAPETAYRHWLKIGAQKKLCRNEEEFYQQIGCQPSALPEDFDYQNYLCLNPDVENKYGKNRYQIIRHFLTHQHKEKRECDLRGNIDILNNYRIAGWILNSNQEHPVELDLYIDEIKIKSLVASIERNDVKPGHRCGFDVRFPSRIYAGQKVELTLRNSKTPILGTPKRVITSVGSINVLHKLGQAAKNDLVCLR